MTWQALFGERATTKIAGTFGRREDAASVINTLREQTRLKAKQLKLIAPDEQKFGTKLEPEDGQDLFCRFAVHIQFSQGCGDVFCRRFRANLAVDLQDAAILANIEGLTFGKALRVQHTVGFGDGFVFIT